MNDTPEKLMIPMFNVTSDPLPMNPQMFTTLGEAIIHWSRIESTIDEEIADMRKWGIVRRLSKVVPHTFSKKVELWRRSVRTLYPLIEAYQQTADGFDEAVTKVAKLRNHLIHGTWTLSENDRGEYLVSNYRSVRGEERHDTMWVGQEALDALLHDVKMLSGVILGFKTSKMLHGHQGLLQATSSPSPTHQAHSIAASPNTPQAPPQ